MPRSPIALLREVRRRRRPPGGEAAETLAALDPRDREIVAQALPHSMVGAPRLLAVVDAVRYCVAREIPGAFVECGVWRGGAALAMILCLQQEGVDNREIHLFDTFTGMTEPTAFDTSPHERAASEVWQEAREHGRPPWPEAFGPNAFGEDRVRALLEATGYPPDQLRLVAGRVEETLPAQAPVEIALLRLDTDWYESTRHELEQLYPRLADAGVLIIDDYGHWDGCRRAVDEYFSARAAPLLLARSDYTGRIAVKH